MQNPGLILQGRPTGSLKGLVCYFVSSEPVEMQCNSFSESFLHIVGMVMTKDKMYVLSLSSLFCLYISFCTCKSSPCPTEDCGTHTADSGSAAADLVFSIWSVGD